MSKERILWSVVLLLSLCLSSTGVAWADGIIIIDPPPDIPIYEVPALTIKYHRVQVSIQDQVAVTQIDQVFVNESGRDLEGTYVFPLPEEAAVSEFAMYVDGEKLEGEILDSDKARRIYEDIVRRRSDPALLEYMGRGAFRARIFPIPAHGEKRVQLEYSEILPLEQGLVRYVYPLNTERFSARPIEEVSIRVDIRSREAIKAVYSPSHDVAVDRQGDYRATVGMEEYDVKPDKDFVLYYSVSPEDVGLNLLSYKPAGERGFFLLLLAPAVEVEAQEVVAKDVVFVLDTSGSMQGEKLAQAKGALKYVLNNLNEGDRFNIISFSTGIHAYATALQPIGEREEALAFVEQLDAVGGTNIERALSEALAHAGRGRPHIVIFLTDGLATEGITDTEAIIEGVKRSATEDTRLFAFGVGDDVNTILLDTISQSHRGTSNYVRPGEDIEAEVSKFYAKISTPLLADLELDFGEVRVEDLHPYPLPDLFVGSQIVLVGRYQEGGPTRVVLSGEVNGRPQRFTYHDVRFSESGGEPFIARLWATRRIGYLLGQIRLHGEDQELVEAIVDLAVRYGIVTPYTSFLIQEDVDILNRAARPGIAEQALEFLSAVPLGGFGKAAVDRAVEEEALRRTDAVIASRPEEVKAVGDKTFINREGVWTDTAYNPGKMTPQKIGFGSETYFTFLAARPEWGRYFSLGRHVIVVLDGQAYEILEGDFPPVEVPTP